MLLRLILFICNAYGNVSCAQLPVEIHMSTEKENVLPTKSSKTNTKPINCDFVNVHLMYIIMVVETP